MRIKLLIILFLSIFFLQSQNALSQEKPKAENFIGIKGGYGYSAINLNVLLTNSSLYLKEGKIAGITFKNLSKKYTGLIMELNYVEKGGQNFYEKSKLTDSTGVIEAEIPFIHSLNYIELPFLMNIRIGKHKSKININGGPHIGYLVKENIKFTETNLTEGQFINHVNLKFEYGINVGIGYGFQFNKGLIDFEIRYSHGLTNIFASQSINNSLISQNQVLVATLAYYIKLK
jgi:hypothetical protein